MSEQATGGGTPPQTPEALAADIERTRHELGETVEALVAKTDVKARAQRRAAEVAGNLRGKARDAKQKAGQARERAAHAPAIPSGSGRSYAAAAAAVTVTLVLAWLALRRRRR